MVSGSRRQIVSGSLQRVRDLKAPRGMTIRITHGPGVSFVGGVDRKVTLSMGVV